MHIFESSLLELSLILVVALRYLLLTSISVIKSPVDKTPIHPRNERNFIYNTVKKYRYIIMRKLGTPPFSSKTGIEPCMAERL